MWAASKDEFNPPTSEQLMGTMVPEEQGATDSIEQIRLDWKYFPFQCFNN